MNGRTSSRQRRTTILLVRASRSLYRRNLPAEDPLHGERNVIPAWNDFDAYSAIFAAGLQLPTYKRFSLNVNLLDNYLNQPAVGFKSNSLQFITGILYTLK